MSSGNENKQPNEILDDGVFRRPFPPSQNRRRAVEREFEDDEELRILMEVLYSDEDQNEFNDQDENWAGWHPLPWLNENERNIQGRAHQAKPLIN